MLSLVTEKEDMTVLAYLILIGAVPLLILCLVVQGVICLIRHRHMSVALFWPDILSIVQAPFVWGCCEGVGSGKSLSNLIEFVIIGAVWGLCFAIRTVLVMRNRPRARNVGSWITLAVMAATAALMGIFFPSLPE